MPRSLDHAGGPKPSLLAYALFYAVLIAVLALRVTILLPNAAQ